jgi:pyruvate formate lyase activating enzyme
MKEALLYVKLDDRRVRCDLCAHRCTIAPGRKGICQVRENQDGTLYTLVYGIPLTQALDPIEKKPLFHFHPGSTAFSIATAGCNFRCSFCQNSDISQMPREQGRINVPPPGLSPTPTPSPPSFLNTAMTSPGWPTPPASPVCTSPTAT